MKPEALVSCCMSRKMFYLVWNDLSDPLPFFFIPLSSKAPAQMFPLQPVLILTTDFGFVLVFLVFTHIIQNLINKSHMSVLSILQYMSVFKPIYTEMLHRGS